MFCKMEYQVTGKKQTKNKTKRGSSPQMNINIYFIGLRFPALRSIGLLKKRQSVFWYNVCQFYNLHCIPIPNSEDDGGLLSAECYQKKQRRIGRDVILYKRKEFRPNVNFDRDSHGSQDRPLKIVPTSVGSQEKD